MTRIQLQIDASEFWPSLQRDIREATEYVYIQSMSFEADRVGKALAAELTACRAADRRIIADEFYTVRRINDNFLHNPKHWFNKAVWQERDDTLAMLEQLRADGVGVKLTNPSGPISVKFLKRNHKKIMAIDDRIVYIGGLNFTEHNFEWHDMMVRIEDAELTRFLKEDFQSTWEGRHDNTSRQFRDIEVYRFDGVHNRVTFQPILDLIADAKRSIYVISPYIAFPFYDPLRKAIANGVEVVLIAPENNNWITMREYLIWESAKAGVDLRMYQGRMMHLKAMLIDDSRLIVGSSNFDFLSSTLMQEVVAVITDKGVIDDFKRRVLDVDLRNTTANTEHVSNAKGLYHIARLKLMPIIVGFLEKIFTLGHRRGE
jgi:cardiolipin synthase A/B